MPSVYLLLRNNRESGPFTIDELLQQQLKPNDLLWVEGKSQSWTLVSEMEFMPWSAEPVVASPQNTSTEVSPVENTATIISFDIETKAEEIKRKALSSKPQKSFSENHREQHTAFTKFTDEDQIDFIDRRKERNTRVHELVTGVFVMGFVLTSIIGGKSLFFGKKETLAGTPTQIITNDNHTATSKKDEALKSITSFQPQVAKPDSFYRTEIPKPILLKRIKKEKKEIVAVLKTEPLTPTAKEGDNAPEVKIAAEPEKKKEIVAEAPKEIVPAPVEKKKSLGQFFKGIFKKKNKEEKTDPEGQ